MAGKQWFPLEANETVMNAYISKMGVDVSKTAFVEVMGLDPDLLAFVPRPVSGVLLLYPIKAASEEWNRVEQAKIDNEGQVVSPNVRFIKQYIGNACGTIGILHALTNARASLTVEPNSYLDKFMTATATMTPDEIAAYLDTDTELEETHEAAAAEGQSDVPEDPTDVNSHFVCITLVDGCLYELDGRKQGPINHGPSTQETLLEDSLKVVQGFMDRDPGEIGFSIVALAAPQSDDA